MTGNKRAFILLTSLIFLMMILAGCTHQNMEPDTANEVDSKTSDVTVSETMISESANTLVVYFSATGNTRPLAEYAAEHLGADIYEIVPQTPYTDADLNYSDSSSRSSVEMNDSNSRPAIAGTLPDISGYDMILIGHPIWWGQAPGIVYTFVENYDWTGKKMATFCTSASSGLGNSAKNLMPSASGNPTWLESRRFPANASKDDVIDWLSTCILQ